MSRTRWERGYRCHGLWIGEQRLAFVGLPPHGISLTQGYGWSVDGTELEGREPTLRKAKHAAERALVRFVAEPKASPGAGQG